MMAEGLIGRKGAFGFHLKSTQHTGHHKGNNEQTRKVLPQVFNNRKIFWKGCAQLWADRWTIIQRFALNQSGSDYSLPHRQQHGGYCFPLFKIRSRRAGWPGPVLELRAWRLRERG